MRNFKRIIKSETSLRCPKPKGLQQTLYCGSKKKRGHSQTDTQFQLLDPKVAPRKRFSDNIVGMRIEIESGRKEGNDKRSR